MCKRLRFLTVHTGLTVISDVKLLPSQKQLRTRKMQLSKHSYLQNKEKRAKLEMPNTQAWNSKYIKKNIFPYKSQPILLIEKHVIE